MKNTKLLRPVAFTLMLIIAVLGVMQCYGVARNDYYSTHLSAFDSEKKGLVDGVLVGTSVIANGWYAPVAWNDYGIAAYHIAMSGLPIGATTAYLDYALRKQDIKYVIVDLHGLRSEKILSNIKPAQIKHSYLKVPDLIAQQNIREALFDYAEEVYEFYGYPENENDIIDRSDISYYIPFTNFHSRWVEGLEKTDFVTKKNQYLGAANINVIFINRDCTKYADYLNFGEVQDINDFQKNQIQKIVDYTNKHNLQLLFINMPSYRSQEEQEDLRNIMEYCKRQGYDTLDFSTNEMIEKLNIDLAIDFLDNGHLNIFGGVKVTRYLCEYLIDNGYYTVDHRGEKKYSEWDEIGNEYIKFYEKGRAYIQKKYKIKHDPYQ